MHQLSGVTTKRIDDDGLHISFGPDRSDCRVLEVDNVVICAGQESVRDLEDGLRRKGIEPHIIGGAALAVELDAKRDPPRHGIGGPAVAQIGRRRGGHGIYCTISHTRHVSITESVVMGVRERYHMRYHL